MLSDLAILNNWWNGLSLDWREIFILNLDLEGMFSPSNIEYILTIESLDCSATSIASLDPIWMLPQLTVLDISSTRIQNLAPLSEKVGLEEFHATFSCIESTTVLSNLTSLQILDLSYPQNQIQDLDVIGEMSNLTHLYLNGCDLRDISPLLELPNLEVLSLYFNPISKRGVNIIRETFTETQILI